MPSEMRKMVFSQDELQAALVNYALRTKRKLPNATIESIHVEEKNEISVTIVYAPDGTEEAKTVEFEQTHVAAAVILFCRTHEIPLPREARKVLVPVDNSVAMIVQMDHSDKSPGIRSNIERDA